jgi:hypothetical protein
LQKVLLVVAKDEGEASEVSLFPFHLSGLSPFHLDPISPVSPGPSPHHQVVMTLLYRSPYWLTDTTPTITYS